MTVSTSYNKYTDTTYAYELSYVWDEKLQRKVQKKKCIGKIDPNTGEVVANAGRGRPQGTRVPAKSTAPAEVKADTGVVEDKARQSFELLSSKCEEFERGIAVCTTALVELKEGMRKIWQSGT
ncbi:MAG: hypothetical protein IJ228_03725 [Succinivibrio sp.]|nr:hypothetical protein [Succinivibrio sp.]